MSSHKGKVIWIILFGGAIVTGGILLYKKFFNKTDPDARARAAEDLAKANPTEANVAAAKAAEQDAELAKHTTPDSFPLKRGSRDKTADYVKRLQLWLLAKFGKAALPRWGADGIFGAETESALTSRGYPAVIDQPWFNNHVSNYEKRNTMIGKAIYAGRDVVNVYEINSMNIHGTAVKGNYLGTSLSIDNGANTDENFIVIDNAEKKLRARVEDVFIK